MSTDLVTWLHDEAPPRRVYGQTPLVLALCQIRYATRIGWSEVSIAPFQQAIEQDYPIPSRQEEVIGIQIGNLGVQSDVPLPTRGVLWKFTDVSGDWTVSLTQDFVSLETRSYADFDDFVERLQHVLAVLIQSVRLGIGRRIGLRYINELRGDGFDWSTAIRPELLGPLALDNFRRNCEQSIQVLTLRTTDARINLQHGLIPDGTTVVPKPGNQPGTGPFYLVDIDMSREFTPADPLAMDSSIIAKYVESYHTTVSNLFRWATTDRYRASLGGNQ